MTDRGEPGARLFLVDVDGTLVSARGAGRTAMAPALEVIYGTRGGTRVPRVSAVA